MDTFNAAQLAQLRAVVREAVKEEFSDAGLRVDDPTHQDEAREDFRFMRRFRKGVDGVSSKIGMAVIMALAGGLIWLVIQGANFWKGQ